MGNQKRDFTLRRDSDEPTTPEASFLPTNFAIEY